MTLFLGVRDFRYYHLKRYSESWPTTQAVIQKCEAKSSGPFLSLWAGKVPKSLFGYSYQVEGIAYIGFFAVLRDQGGAFGAAWDLQEKLAGNSLTVRYDPTRPQRSFVVDSEVLGKEVHQGPEWLPRSLTALTSGGRKT